MRMFIPHFFYVALFLLAAPAIAEGDAAKMLEVGDKIPADFSVVDSFGREVSFESMKAGKGALLMFIRSADWCQYCKAQLKEWNSMVDEIKAKGYSLASVSYDKPNVLRDFAKSNQISYAMLSDTDSKMIRAFGIRNAKFEEGSRFYGIPNPAIYVFDAQGNVSYVFREEGYKIRPNIDEVMAALEPEAIE